MNKVLMLKKGGFYFAYRPEVRPYWSAKIGNMFLGTDLFGKILLKQAFKKLYGDKEGRQKFGRFREAQDYIYNYGAMGKNTGIYKLIIHTPISFTEENFKFGYNAEKKFFYFMGDKGNIIRFGGKPNFIIEAYQKLYDKQEFLDLVKAFRKSTDMSKYDNEIGIFKIVYDFNSINKILFKS